MNTLQQQLVDSLIAENQKLIQEVRGLLRSCDSLHSHNRNLIEANRQLTALSESLNNTVTELTSGAQERERYVQYLESTLVKTGWNPNESH